MGRAATLYRAIRRAHKHHLPSDMRSLGDSYVRAEFQRHKTAQQENHIARFYTEWDKYLEQILRQGDVMGDTGFGKDLPHDVELTEDQKTQLQKLHAEAVAANKQN